MKLNDEAEKALKELNLVKTPIRYSLSIAFLWTIIIILLTFLLQNVNEYTLTYNINITSLIGIIIAAIWTCVKFGFMEKFLWEFKNMRNGKLARHYDKKPKDFKISLDEYKTIRKQHSWVGLFVFLSACLLIYVITFIII